MSQESRLKNLATSDSVFITVLVGGLLFIICQLWLITPRFTQTTSERIDLMNVATSVLLTIVLIGVYGKMARDNSKQTHQMGEQVDSMEDQTEKMERQLESIERQTESMEQQTKEMEKQANLQKQVADIQKRQQRLMEAQHNPELILQDTFEADEDTLILELSNKGTGLAKNIGLDIEFFVNEEDSNSQLVPIEERVVTEKFEDERRGPVTGRRGFGDMSHSFFRSSASGTPSVDAGTVLTPGETEILNSKIRLWYYSGVDALPGDGRPIFFSSAVRNLQEMGINVLAYRIHLTYQNILDEDHDPQHLATGAVRISNDPDLQEILDSRHRTGIINMSSHPFGKDGLRAEFHLPHY